MFDARQANAVLLEIDRGRAAREPDRFELHARATTSCPGSTGSGGAACTTRTLGPPGGATETSEIGTPSGSGGAARVADHHDRGGRLAGVDGDLGPQILGQAIPYRGRRW